MKIAILALATNKVKDISAFLTNQFSGIEEGPRVERQTDRV
jgi:hypothetical protein